MAVIWEKGVGSGAGAAGACGGGVVVAERQGEQLEPGVKGWGGGRGAPGGERQGAAGGELRGGNGGRARLRGEARRRVPVLSVSCVVV